MKTPTRLIVDAILTATVILGAGLGLAFGQDTTLPDGREKEISVEIITEGNPDEDMIWIFSADDMALWADDLSGLPEDIFEDFGYEFDLPESDDFFFPDTTEANADKLPAEYREQMREVRRQMEKVRHEMRRVRRELPRQHSTRAYARMGSKPGAHGIKMPTGRDFPFRKWMLYDTLDADTLPTVIILKRRDGSDSLLKKIVRGSLKGQFMSDSLAWGPAFRHADSMRVFARHIERKDRPGRAQLYRHHTPRAGDFQMTVPRSGRTLVVSDLKDSDIKRLKSTSLKPAKSAQPLGIDRIGVNQAGKDKIRLKFTAPQNNELEIILYNEEGESFYHEVLKQFEGVYDKVIQTGPFREIYLKLKQGKKALTKKIIPDR